MMKTIFLTMAAAICVATPAAAQPWQARGNQQSAELQAQIDAGVRSGSISQAELPALRASLRQLSTLERQLSIGGLTGREHANLQQRGNMLRQQISFASQTRGRFENRGRYDNDGRFDADGRLDNDGRADSRYDSDNRDAREDRYNDRDSAWTSGRGDARFSAGSRFEASNRGDRFAGDVRVGQRVSSRMGAMPVQYRSEFRDSADVYYRYDSDRAYEIDRRSGRVLRLFDLVD